MRSLFVMMQISIKLFIGYHYLHSVMQGSVVLLPAGVLVFEQVYDTFLEKLRAKAEPESRCWQRQDLGPVVSENQRQGILRDISNAILEGGKVECGGVAANSQV